MFPYKESKYTGENVIGYSNIPNITNDTHPHTCNDIPVN
jgi:hypothetical protein